MKLTKISLLVVPLLALSLLVGSSTAEASGGRGGTRGGMQGGHGFGFGPGGPRDNVTIEIIKLGNGIQTVITTDDEEVLERLHEHADRHALMQSIEHSVTNIENGVQIEVTSSNPDAVEMIQSREPREPRHEDVTVTQENITGGVRITITSTTPEHVERIQEMAEKGKHGQGMHGGRKGRGRGSMGSFEMRGFGRFSR